MHDRLVCVRERNVPCSFSSSSSTSDRFSSSSSSGLLCGVGGPTGSSGPSPSLPEWSPSIGLLSPPPLEPSLSLAEPPPADLLRFSTGLCPFGEPGDNKSFLKIDESYFNKEGKKLINWLI